MNKTKLHLKSEELLNATVSFGGGGDTGSSGSTGIYGDSDNACFWGSVNAVGLTVAAAATKSPATAYGAAVAWGQTIDACTSDLGYGPGSSSTQNAR